ncbi:MAG: hypothetical protein PHV78_00330 [Patescibacteria group bacterium]|nr:hypothetical protein [Patescibacteria group bacterium]MDD5121381.1 hypothetical protein [Patescibacteria group bacterium]MDD5395700.1 hypothetical protein [Patescibacteria group bacterium]
MLNKAIKSETQFQHHRFIALVFLGLFVILLIVAGLFFLPSAQVILRVNREPYGAEQLVRIDSSIKEGIYQLDTVPGIVVRGQKINTRRYFLSDKLFDPQTNRLLTCRLSDLDALFKQKLIDTTYGDRAPLKDKFVIYSSQVTAFDPVKETAIVTFFVTNEVIPVYDFAKIKNQLVNKTVDEAKDYLRTLPNLQSSKIINSWSQKARLPASGERIKIRLDII